MKRKVVIIGAGMAGCFMAVSLAKRGYNVSLYEYRPDVRREPYDSGRSFNLTLYYRGIQAMKRANIWNEVKKISVIAEGNVAHYGKRKLVYDPFDAQGDEILYTVHRNQLNGVLLTIADTFPQIKLHFNTRCIGVNREKKVVSIQKEGTKHVSHVNADLIIGADGVNSVVRADMNEQKIDKAVKKYEDWGYKEVHISPKLTQTMKLRIRATHTWPRKESLLIAFPNPDDSFTLMFNLPLEGKNSFTELTDKAHIQRFIHAEFPDLAPIFPQILNSFLNKPTGNFVSLYADPWFFKDWIVLIGDAAHAVIPFYGQGVCAAFEDCLLLTDLMQQYNDNWAKILPAYQQKRKENTDLLARLSKENFIELRDKSRSPFYIFKDKADTFLHRLFPKLWLPPLYVLIAHGNLEYKEALKLHEKQQRLARKIGLDFALFTLAIPWFITNKLKKMTT